MTNHPSRIGRLQSAMNAASAIISSGSVTLIGDAAHDAAVLTRYQAAEIVINSAMAERDYDLSSAAYLAAAEKRHMYRECIASLKSRM